VFRKRTLRVEPDTAGGWIVRIEAGQEARRYPRKRDATLAAREYLKNSGGGELLIQNLSGRFTERDSVPSG
jgi:Uncharacterized protein conserved in bacteria (DUF2188)